MNLTHFKVTHGALHEICTKWHDAHAAAIASVDALARKYKAAPGRRLSRGSSVEGFFFGAAAPEGWKATRHIGYFTPGRGKAGMAIAKELKAIRIPVQETLAVDLGCKPFFHDFDDGGNYCASCAVFMFAGAFYLQTSKWCPPKIMSGIEEIPASEWHKADEDRAAQEKDKP